MKTLELRLPENKSKRRVSIPFCDCGNIAYKKDGSGWFCKECELMVKRVSAMMDRWLIEQRAEQFFDERLERRKEWNKQVAYFRRIGIYKKP